MVVETRNILYQSLIFEKSRYENDSVISRLNVIVFRERAKILHKI